MDSIVHSGTSPTPQDESLGVIISMPPTLAAELGQRRRSYAPVEAALIPAHITLVSGRATGDWENAAAHVREVAARAHPFTVSLKGVGSFAPLSPVVFLKLAQGVNECVSLHKRLLEGPLEHLPNFDFHPHLTMAHDLPEDTMSRAEAELAGYSANLQVVSVGLYNFVDGAWDLREELSLGPDSGR